MYICITPGICVAWQELGTITYYPLGEKLSLGYSFAVYLPDFAASL